MTPSCAGGSPGLQCFTAATRAKPAGPMVKAAKTTLASSTDPSELLRLDRSRAQTQKGFKRLANAITRDAIGIPLTRRQHAEIRREQERLDPAQIYKNIYRSPCVRQRAPREMQGRRRPGMTNCQFVLPKAILEGLRRLAKTVC